MAAVALWIDHEKARMFRLMPGQARAEKLENIEYAMHGPRENHGHDKRMHKYFSLVAKELQGAEAVLLLGPGTAKTEFKHFLERHHGGQAKAIVGFVDMGYGTDAQILQECRSFFKKYDRYFDRLA